MRGHATAANGASHRDVATDGDGLRHAACSSGSRSPDGRRAGRRTVMRYAAYTCNKLPEQYIAQTCTLLRAQYVAQTCTMLLSKHVAYMCTLVLLACAAPSLADELRVEKA